MSETEARMYAGVLTQQVDRIVDALQDLTLEEMDMTPPVPESNTPLVLAVHTMANVEENVLEIIGGEDVGRDRESEFLAEGKSADHVAVQWISLKARINTALDSLPDEVLDEEHEHPRRGRITARKVLFSATVHAAEHAGHAELTRDWIVAQR